MRGRRQGRDARVRRPAQQAPDRGDRGLRPLVRRQEVGDGLAPSCSEALPFSRRVSRKSRIPGRARIVKDCLHASALRRSQAPGSFPIVNVSLIVANFAVWIFYELPHLNRPSSTPPSTPAPSTAPATGPSRGGSAGSRRCSCTAAGTTSSATCCSWPSSARTSRTRSARSATSPSTSPAASSRR